MGSLVKKGNENQINWVYLEGKEVFQFKDLNIFFVDIKVIEEGSRQRALKSRGKFSLNYF